MEGYFQQDFSDVRVHVGSEAGAIGALAFTVGGALDIGLGGGTLLFGAGSFEASLAAAAVLGLGQAGLNALFPSSVKTKADKNSEMGSAGARQNVLNPGDYLPRPIGKTKVWPPQVSRPIRFFEGRDELVEALEKSNVEHQTLINN